MRKSKDLSTEIRRLLIQCLAEISGQRIDKITLSLGFSDSIEWLAINNEEPGWNFGKYLIDIEGDLSNSYFSVPHR